MASPDLFILLDLGIGFNPDCLSVQMLDLGLLYSVLGLCLYSVLGLRHNLLSAD